MTDKDHHIGGPYDHRDPRDLGVSGIGENPVGSYRPNPRAYRKVTPHAPHEEVARGPRVPYDMIDTDPSLPIPSAVTPSSVSAGGAQGFLTQGVEEVAIANDIGHKISTAPVVSGFTRADQDPHLDVPTFSTTPVRPLDIDSDYARPQDPAHEFVYEDKIYRENTPAVDPVLAEAFSPLPHEGSGLQPDPLMGLGQLPAKDADNPWSDPYVDTVLGDPAKKAKSEWEPKIIPGKKLGIRELLFGRLVSKKALLTIVIAVLCIAGVGGYIGRITGETQIKLTGDSSYVRLSTDPGTSVQDPIEKVAEQDSWTVVQVIASFSTSASFGSGVVVSPEGYIWTNNHVISDVASEKNPNIKVVFRDKTRVDAHLVGRDPKTDVAVLKVEVKDLKVAVLGDSDKLRPGQRVVAIGGPFGLAQTVTTGIVSYVHRPWTGTKDMPMADDCIQVDASINEGNSGGGLFDMDGRLVGITNGQESFGAGSLGINFAISINQFKAVAESITRTGKAEHPWLGISVESVTRKSGSGAKVVNIVDSSPASAAGLKENDIIISMNGTTISSAQDLVLAEILLPIGKKAHITVVRDGKEENITITPVAGKS